MRTLLRGIVIIVVTGIIASAQSLDVELQRAVQEGIAKSLSTPEAERSLDAAEQVRELLRKAGGR